MSQKMHAHLPVPPVMACRWQGRQNLMICGVLRYSTSFSGYKILLLSNLMTLQHGVSLLLSQLLHFVSMRPSHGAGWLVAG